MITQDLSITFLNLTTKIRR